MFTRLSCTSPLRYKCPSNAQVDLQVPASPDRVSIVVAPDRRTPQLEQLRAQAPRASATAVRVVSCTSNAEKNQRLICSALRPVYTKVVEYSERETDQSQASKIPSSNDFSIREEEMY